MANMSILSSKSMEADFNVIKDMLSTGENFSFSRFSDGEMLIANGIEVAMQADHNEIGNIVHDAANAEDDIKHFDPQKHINVSKAIQRALIYNAPNYFKGLNCYCCSGSMWPRQMIYKERTLAGSDLTKLTWANLLINSNYNRFVKEIIPILKTRDLYMVVNKNARLDESQFDIKHSFRVGQNCMVNDTGIIQEIKDYIDKNEIKDGVFMCAASSLSNMVIHECHMHNTDNTYIDIGSSLNPFLPGIGSRRGYMDQLNDPQTMQECMW